MQTKNLNDADTNIKYFNSLITDNNIRRAVVVTTVITFNVFLYSSYTSNLVYHKFDVDDLLNITDYAMDIGIGLSTDSSWKVASWINIFPGGLRKLINWIADQYGNPEIMITENGIMDDGSTLNDTDRIQYLTVRLC